MRELHLLRCSWEEKEHIFLHLCLNFISGSSRWGSRSYKWSYICVYKYEMHLFIYDVLYEFLITEYCRCITHKAFTV